MPPHPGGPVYFKKSGAPKQSTMCCFVVDPNKPGKLFALVCHHTVKGSDDNRMYLNVDLETELGIAVQQPIGQGEGDQDFALVEIHSAIASGLKQGDFHVDQSKLPLRGITQVAAGADIVFAGSKSRMEDGLIAPQAAATTAGPPGHRFGIAGGKNAAFTCRGGDSGAPVFTDQGLLAGMYHMGDGGDAGKAGSSGFVIDIGPIFRQLRVQLATWNDRASWLPRVREVEEPPTKDDPFADWSGSNPMWTPSGKT